MIKIFKLEDKSLKIDKNTDTIYLIDNFYRIAVTNKEIGTFYLENILNLPKEDEVFSLTKSQIDKIIQLSRSETYCKGEGSSWTNSYAKIYNVFKNVYPIRCEVEYNNNNYDWTTLKIFYNEEPPVVQCQIQIERFIENSYL